MTNKTTYRTSKIINLKSIVILKSLNIFIIAWDIDLMTRVTIHDANLPFNVWDLVVEHMTLVDSMTTYATNDSSQTIFEIVYCVKPSFDNIPPVG